jgi:hypothetical protein
VAVVALAGFLFVGWELDRAEGRKPEEEGESFGSLVLFFSSKGAAAWEQKDDLVKGRSLG